MSDEIYENEEFDSNDSDAGDNGGDLKSLRRAASGKKQNLMLRSVNSLLLRLDCP